MANVTDFRVVPPVSRRTTSPSNLLDRVLSEAEESTNLLSDVGSNKSLEALEKWLGLDEFVMKGPAQKGQDVPRATLASTVEALIGAVWVDIEKDFDQVQSVIGNLDIEMFQARVGNGNCLQLESAGFSHMRSISLSISVFPQPRRLENAPFPPPPSSRPSLKLPAAATLAAPLLPPCLAAQMSLILVNRW